MVGASDRELELGTIKMNILIFRMNDEVSAGDNGIEAYGIKRSRPN